MDRIIGMILEMVFTALLVVFLLGFLIRGSINGGSGVWGGMAHMPMQEGKSLPNETSELAKTIAGASAAEFRCNENRVSVNRIYGLSELFPGESANGCYLELKGAEAEGGQVLARGTLALLAEEDAPAYVLYDSGTEELMFTKKGDYRISLLVGTEYGRKPYKEIWVTVTAVSSATLTNGGKGE